MRKIRYNIAENKKINFLKFGLFSLFVVVISLVFVMLGVGNLWSSDKRARDQKEQLIKDRQEIETLTRETAQLKQDVQNKKKGWKKRVSFANLLIKGRHYSAVAKLDILEKHLPEGVFITNVILDVENPGVLQVNISADSLARLIETYNSFSKYRPTIKNETEDEGLLKADLILHLKAKKKKTTAETKPGADKKIAAKDELESALGLERKK
jgi:hypothetical protein